MNESVNPQNFPMPIIFGMGGMGSHRHPVDKGLDFNEAPVRVDKAMEVLHLMMRKQAKGTVAAHANSGMGNCIEVFDGTQLRKSEELLIDNACHFLSGYFAAEARQEESLRMEAMVADMEKNEDDRPEGSLLRCMACIDKGRIQKSCTLCKGSGHVIVTPVSVDNEEGGS